MKRLISYFKSRPHLLILGIILILGLFFRTYKIIDRFEFAHDGDLYSWMVKDILVNHHFRLIGQLTSAPGIFVGPLFYYLLVPFFASFNMDPIGVILPAIIINMLTIISYYLVLSRLFNKQLGLIAAFLYSVLISSVNFDRWVVPTITTPLWAIWYLYCLLNLSRGNFSVLPILGILIGTIWHVHIALTPTLLAIPIALVLSGKIPKLKQLLLFFITLAFTSIPLILFELRHNFSQTLSLFHNFTTGQASGTGLTKLIDVVEKIAKNVNALFFSPQSLPEVMKTPFLLLLILLPVFIIKIKLLKLKEIITLYCWIFGVTAFFTLSSSPISEYYFSNLDVIFITFVSLFFYLLFKSSTLGRYLILILLSVVLIKNLIFLISVEPYHKGYAERKAVVDYIKKDAQNKGFPCVGITYITTPGENVGFRYFFYLSNLHLTHPSLDVPVYNIVIPDELSHAEVKLKFGHIGIIPPAKFPSKEVIEKSCQTLNTNLTDSMFGYTD